MAVESIDHLVFIVSDINRGIQQWQKLGLKLTHRASIGSIKMEQAFFMLNDDSFIELIAPASEDSPLQKTLQDSGEGFLTVALKVQDFDATIENLQANEIELRGVGTDQTLVHPRSSGGVRIQLWDSERPHRWQANPRASSD